MVATYTASYSSRLVVASCDCFVRCSRQMALMFPEHMTFGDIRAVVWVILATLFGFLIRGLLWQVRSQEVIQEKGGHAPRFRSKIPFGKHVISRKRPTPAANVEVVFQMVWASISCGTFFVMDGRASILSSRTIASCAQELAERIHIPLK